MLTIDAWITSAHTSQSDTDIAWQTYMLPVLTASALIGLSLATLLCARVRQFFCPPPPLQWVAPSAASPHWARQNQTHPKRITEQVPALLEPEEPTTPFNDPGMAQIIMQNIGLREEALNMSAVNKNLYAARFQSPALQHFRFKKAAHVNQFLAYCQHMQETIKCGALRTQEAFYPVHQLSLILSDELTAEQCVPLFYYLPQIERLEIIASLEEFDDPPETMGPSLQILLTAAQSMSLQHLHIEGPSGFIDDAPEDFLPDTLWQLTTLKTLKLAWLNISGISEKIGNLQALKKLVLKDPFFSLPEALWELKKLEHLDLHMAGHSTLSEKIGNLQGLTSLSLWGSLLYLPDSIWNLKKLKKLSLFRLKLSALSEKLGNLQALTSLSLYKIPLLALPANIWSLKKLEKLSLQYLSLTSIPEDIGNLQQLTELRLTALEIHTLPKNLWKLEKLEKLYLADLPFVTALSERIENLQALTYLSLYKIPLETLPGGLWKLANLTELHLCHLEELIKISKKIANLRNLTALKLIILPKISSLPVAVFPLTSLNRITIATLGFPFKFQKGEYIW
jgi:Leucine-rich repeat (LRR) protein